MPFDVSLAQLIILLVMLVVFAAVIYFAARIAGAGYRRGRRD